MTTPAPARSRLMRLSGLLCLLAVAAFVLASSGHHHPAARTGAAGQVEKACTVCAVFAGMEAPDPARAWSHPTAPVRRSPVEAAQRPCAPPAFTAEGRAPPSA